MRLVEHLHVAEILREAEEDRQRGLASGQEAVVPRPGVKKDLDLGASGSIQTVSVRDTVDAQMHAAGMEGMPGVLAHKGTGLSFPPAESSGIDPIIMLRGLVVFAVLMNCLSKKDCTSPTSPT